MRGVLGGFELLVLLALIRLGDDAYGVPISNEIEASSGRSVSVGSVDITLDRLERKGLVSSTLGESTAERGGRAKTYFRPTAKGLREARLARRTLMRLWQRVPQLEGEAAMRNSSHRGCRPGCLERLAPRHRLESLMGDLREQVYGGRSAWWYRRQVFGTILVGLAADVAAHKLLAVRDDRCSAGRRCTSCTHLGLLIQQTRMALLSRWGSALWGESEVLHHCGFIIASRSCSCGA